MEEDTGKLMHERVNGQQVSLIDFNRSGSPLVEIVTEPDFTSSEEVKEYLQKLQQIVRYLGVADADMEKGGMRLEPNISLRPSTDKNVSSLSEHSESKGRSFELPNYKVEVKNINSFSFVSQAIAYELNRQAELLDKGETPTQETRGWDEDKHKTISQRSKEEAADYRYFPEPDIPPFVFTEKYMDQLRSEIPELPDARAERFSNMYELSDYNTRLLTRSIALANYFEEAVTVGKVHAVDPKTIANVILNKKIDTETVLPASLIKTIVEATHIVEVSHDKLDTVLKKVIEQNEKVVTDYKSGKTNAIMFLVGIAMQQLRGRAKADTVKQELEKLVR